MKETNSRVISLNKLLRKGICYEDIQDFKESIYHDVYKRAKEAVIQIVESNEELRLRQAREKTKRNTEIANVVSFIGRRGTGKSSSMLSFLEALSQRINDRYDEKLFVGEAGMDSVRFFTLECIDAAALEESESVFTLVLAQMLSSISEINDDSIDDMDLYPKRSLMQSLGDIYKDYNSLKEACHDIQRRDYSAIENLKHAASSQRIRISFENLVAKYLQFMRQINHSEKIYHSERTKDFLVIAVDDLDMSHYNERISTHRQINIRSYEIMRDISKYFSVPGVIVLVAYNHTSLQQQLCGFFMSGNAGYYNEIKHMRDVLRSGETLASEFMEKVLTPVYRIYMPSWKKEDYYFQDFFIHIGEAEVTDDDVFSCFRKEGRYKFSKKDLILILYAKKAGLFYDNTGQKRHFLEPDSLRGLNSLLYLLLGRRAQYIEGQGQLCIKNEDDENSVFKRIMDDVYFRFTHERLYLEKEKILLNNLLESKIDMRSEEIVNRIARKIEPLGRMNKQMIRQYEGAMSRNVSKKGIKKIIKRMRKNVKASYSYAELVHCIYHMTRENIHSKEFVACILHSYSVHLTQIYKQYRKEKIKFFDNSLKRKEYINYYRYPKAKNINDKEHEKMRDSYQLLKGVIGNTVLGRWMEYFMPVFRIRRENHMYVCAAASMVNMPGAEFSEIFDIKDEEQDIKKMLYECIYLMFMYPDILQWRSLTIKLSTDKHSNHVRQVEISNKQGEFEPAAFIKFSILYVDYLPKIESLLKDAFTVRLGEEDFVLSFKKKVQVQIERVFNCLWKLYCNWDAVYGNMILPIYAFDLMYNMIKHLFQQGAVRKNYEVDLVKRRAFLEEFWNTIVEIKSYLQKVDRFYCLEGKSSFAEVFWKSPYVRILNILRRNKEFAEITGRQMDFVLTVIVNNYILQLPGDDGERVILL